MIAKLGPGDSVAVLVARDRVTPLVAPASFDMKKVEAALADLPRARGTSDLPMALAEALRLLEPPGNPARDVIILTDGQRFAWRPDEPARWSIAREIHQDLSRRSGVSPRIWAINFDSKAGAGGPNGSVAPLELSGGLITPNRPITDHHQRLQCRTGRADAHGRARDRRSGRAGDGPGCRPAPAGG